MGKMFSSTRREFGKTVLGGAAALAGSASAFGRATKERPNIIFLLTDDQRWDQMSCAGHPVLRTPNMDRIAREGVMFRNMFVTTSLCSPSRASFLTGRYVHAHGVKDNKPKTDIAEAEMRHSYPYLLREAGYQTAYVGKFHMGNHPQPHPGFDYWAALPGQGRYIDPEFNINGEMKVLKGYSGAVTTDLALDFLKQRKQDKPFCLALGFKEVHDPRTPPEHLKTLYSDAKVEMPPITKDQFRGKPAAVRKRFELAGKVAGKGREENIRNYWRCVISADEQIGRVLNFLDEAKLAENTIVAFAGDNGYFMGEFGLGDKRWGYEPSLRIPMLMRYPKLIKPGTKVDEMALNIDLCPTLLDLAGVSVPKRAHGSSWRPLLEGRKTKWRESFLYEYFHEDPYVPPTIRGLRTEQYKYLSYPGSTDGEELYDLKADPHEWNNLADKPEHRSLIAKLRAEAERIETHTS